MTGLEVHLLLNIDIHVMRDLMYLDFGMWGMECLDEKSEAGVTPSELAVSRKPSPSPSIALSLFLQEPREASRVLDE